jgi:phosphohistidine phosphatase SixA
MKVYLVRHGEAGKAPRDRDRTLTVFGREQVCSLAENLEKKGPKIGRIYHSGLVRAEETSAFLKEKLAPLVNLKERKGLLPDDIPASWMEELESADEGDEIMLVGHNPFMALLSGLLLDNGDIVSFSVANAACFERDGLGWNLSWVCGPSL